MSDNKDNTQQVNAFKEMVLTELEKWEVFIQDLRKDIEKTEEGKIITAFDFANKLITTCDKEWLYWQAQQEQIQKKASEAAKADDTIKKDENE